MTNYEADFDTTDQEILNAPDPKAVVAKRVEASQPALATSPIPMNEKTQLMVARDNSDLMRIIKIMMAGAAFPKTLDTDAKIIAAWQVAASLNLPPAIAIQNLAVIHGSVSMWGQLPKALAERTGELEDFKLMLIDKDHNVISLANKNLESEVWGAVCQIKRKGRSINEYTFSEKDAKKAGLKGKAGPWTSYEKIMYQRRAVAHALKFEFPDALMGVPVAEYDYNDAPDLRDVGPSNSDDSAQSLRAKLTGAV